MKDFIVFALLFVSALGADEDYCYQDATRACKSPIAKRSKQSDVNCNALYGGISGVFSDLESYANSHFARSFHYLLMSTHYGNYGKNRLGFEKFSRTLSDDTWNKGIELIKYMTKRGARMNFNNIKEDKINNKHPPYEVSELQGMAKALDMERGFAQEAMNIHYAACRHHHVFHDPEVAHYLEEEFMEPQAELIRKIAGYTSDLKDLVFSNNTSLGLYMFDEMLQK